MKKILNKTVFVFDSLALILIIACLIIRYYAEWLMYSHNGVWPKYVIGENPCINYLYQINYELWYGLGEIVLLTWYVAWIIIFPYALLKLVYSCYRYYTKKSRSISRMAVLLLFFSMISTLAFGSIWLITLTDDLTDDYPINYCDAYNKK